MKLPFEVPPAPDEEARRRRVVAVGALVAAFVMFVLVVGLATCGDGGGGRGEGEPVATTKKPKAPAKRKRARKPRAAPGAVPPTAPGAHRDPKAAVPILAYRFVNTPPPGTADPEDWVPREDFRAQMKYLADKGYHAITLQQLWDAWHSNGLLPSKPIVISFDDGYHSQYSNAFPILRARGWPGLLNLQVDQLQEDLKPPEVKQMIAAGWEVGAHSITNADLTAVDAAQLEEEVAGSRRQLRQRFGAPVNFFCYPAGSFDDTVVEAVKAAGYLGATTTQQPGVAKPDQSPYELPRVRVKGSDGVEGMANSLSAAEAGQTGGDQGGA